MLVPEPGVTKPVRLKLAVTPAGMPLTIKETGALNPVLTATVTVAEPFCPACICNDAGAAVRAKLPVTMPSRQ
jgi:hypothetical protein